MDQPGRDGFDAQVALATSRARVDTRGTVAAPAHAPAQVPARGTLSLLLRLAKRVLQPLLFRLRRYFTAPLHEDMLLLREALCQEIHLAEQRERHADARHEALLATHEQTREEMRLIYSGLLDQLHANAVRSAEDTAECRQALRDLQSLCGEHEQDRAARDRELSGQLVRVENYTYASARRVAVPCGENELLVKTEAGYVICSGSDLSVLSTLVETGELERGTRLVIQNLLRPGDVFIDVGANIGMHTIAGGRAMAGQGTIIAFEPFEPTRRLLEKSVWMNGLGSITRVHGCAVSHHAGAHSLFLGASSGHHSLFAHDSEGVRTLGQVEVQTVRLDDVIEGTQHVSLLKIDAEGAELDVLAGAAATIGNSPDIALIVEFGPSHLRATGQDSAAWLAAFAAHGLEFRAIDELTGSLVRCDLADLEKTESTNLFFARPGSAAWMNMKEIA